MQNRLILLATLFIYMAAHLVVIDHADGLHESVNDHRAGEFEAAFF